MRRLLFGLLLWAASVLPAAATINLINGHVQGPGNVVVPNGSITLQLNMDASVIAPPGGQVLSSQVTTCQFDSSGNIVPTCAIWSNAELNPQNALGLGTWYWATFYDSNGTRVNSVAFPWAFPNSSGASVDISFMTLTATSSGTIYYPSPAVAPVASTGVQWVAKTGSDSNNGLSWGQAAANISTAIANLPACSNPKWFSFGSYASVNWTHCGVVFLGAGVFTVSNVTITSPEVAIIGLSPQATTISCITSSGACLKYSVGSSNNAMDTNGSAGLYNLTIDGFNASAGTFGLQTDDISSFEAQNVQIQNFTGAGSVCYYDTATSSYNEKQDIDIRTNNCKIAWEVNPGAGSQGYPATTFGYGRHKIACLVWANQNCFTMTNGQITQDNLQLTVNLSDATATGMVLTNAATIFQNLINIHIEGQGGQSGAEVSMASGTQFQNNGGYFNQDQGNTNTINSAATFYPIGQETAIYGISGATIPGRVNTWDIYAPSSTNINYGDSNVLNYRSATNASQLVAGKTFYSNQLGTGTLAELDGALFQPTAANSSGAITTSNGIRILAPSLTGSGSITTQRGIQIDPQSGSGVGQGYAFVQSGTSDLNVFQGTTDFTLASNQLVFGATHTVTANFAAPAASRTLTFPDPGANANVAYGTINDCGTSTSCASPSAKTSPIILTTGHVAFSASTTQSITSMPVVYTSGATYTCTASDQTHAYTWTILNNSNASFTITSGTSNSDTWTWTCIGY